MSPAADNSLLDIAILRILDANRTRFGLMPDALALRVERFGFSPTTDEILDRVQYLTDKGLAEEVLKGIHRANRAWRITPTGITFLDEQK